MALANSASATINPFQPRIITLGSMLCSSDSAIEVRPEAASAAAAFAAAQAAGKPILVAVHADWCPTCAKQKPILSKLGADPAMKELMVFVVDFDTQKEITQRFGVRMQSTLIVFRGTAERDRSVGVTDEAALKALLAKAVA